MMRNHQLMSALWSLLALSLCAFSVPGYQRRQGLAAALNYSSLDNTTYFRPLYNQDDVTCVYSHMLASKAASMTGDDLIVQPLLASLKYMMGTVDGMQEEMMFSNNADTKSNPSLDIILCPGAGVADVNAADANATDSLSWDVILEALKTDMVASLFTAEQSFFDANYVTTEAFFSDTSKQGVTARTLWWKQIIQNYVKTSCYCDDMYANRLKWTIQRTGNPDTTDSVLNVEVGTSGDVEHDTTSHPNVCSLESRQRVRTHTVPVADWLTQSEVRDGTPFFDVSFGAIFAACLHDWKNSSMQLETPCYLHIGAECKHRFGARRERDVGRYDDGGELRQFPVDQSMRFDEPNQGAHWFANGFIENLFNYFVLVFLFPFRFPL